MEDGISRGLQHCYETCYEKGSRHRRWACIVQKWFHHGDVVSGQVDLYMTLIPIHLYLQKLRGRSQLRAHSLPANHILCLLMESNSDTSLHLHLLLLSSLTRCQHG